MISLRARIVRLLTKQMFKKISPTDHIPSKRAGWEEMAARLKPAQDVRLRHATVSGIDCDWLVPSGCEESSVLLYLHGGAYIMGSSRTHRAMVSYIAKEAGMRALLPNYRLAPEYPFPAGLDDCVAVYRALLDGGTPPERIAIAGDSAGGGMTMAVLLSLRDAGIPVPAAGCLLSPWLDLAAAGESIHSRADKDPWFNPHDMPIIVAYYCREKQVRLPLVSPVYADVHGMPPLLVQVGDHEILLSDSTRMVDKINAAGGQATLQVWPDMWHVFQYFIGKMPESMRAIEDLGAFLKLQLATATARAGNKAA